MTRGGILTAVLIFASLLGVSRPAGADLRREIEPNDAPAQATPLRPPVSMGGRIAVAGDSDVFAVRVPGGGTLQASILARGFRADTSPGSSLTARLSILASDGVTLMAQDVSQGGFDDPAISLMLTDAGTYFVVIEDDAGQGGPDYTYILSIEIEPNGDVASATPIVPPVLPSIDAVIWPPGDHDLYRFDATAGQVVTLEFDSAVFNPNAPAVKGVMTLYAPDHSVVASDAYSASTPVDPFIQATLPVTGTYVVDVHDLRGFVGGPTSIYQISVELGPAPGNDTTAAAEPVPPAAGLSGTLCPAGDRDDARFTLPAPAIVGADLDAREDLQSLLTGSLSFLNPSGTLLALDASSPDPALSSSLPAGDTVVSVQGTSSGLCQDAYWQLWIDPDADGDGLRLPHDNCPGIFNPGQQDSDGDGVGDACDDCIAVFNPGQEPNLRTQAPVGDTLTLVQGAGLATLSWSPAPGAVASNVYRVLQTFAGQRPSYACRADNVFGAGFTDADVPPAGSVFFYVVTGENCGESPAGSDSSGAPVTFIACPGSV